MAAKRTPTPLPPRPRPEGAPPMPPPQAQQDVVQLSPRAAVRQLNAMTWATARCAELEDELTRASGLLQQLAEENTRLKARIEELEKPAEEEAEPEPAEM